MRAAMPIGTLMKKIHGQLKYVMSAPPTVGPAMVARPATPPQTPNAAPRRSGGNSVVMMDRVCGVRMAPPMPWRMRKAMSSVAFCEMPHSADATVKTKRPMAKRLRCPYRSPSRPAVINSTA